MLVKIRNVPVFSVMVLCLGFVDGGFASQERAIPPEALETLRVMAIQHNGRLKPFDSFARETLDHLTGNPQWGEADPVETVLSIMAQPDQWQDVPLIQAPFLPLREALGLDRKTTRISYQELVGTRKLMRMLPVIVAKQERDETLTILEQETMDVYDRFVTLTRVFQQEVPLVPGLVREDPWLSMARPEESPEGPRAADRAWIALIEAIRGGDAQAIAAQAAALTNALRAAHPAAYPPRWRLELEVALNRLHPFRLAQGLYALAALAWLLGLSPSRRSWARAGMGLVLGAFCIHGLGLLVRVILAGRPPVSNFYETMLWMPFVAVALSVIFERVYRMGYAGFGASVAAAITLGLADRLPLDPSLVPIVAVLRSNFWLTIHVLTMVGSYAPITLAMVLAHLYGWHYLVGGRRHAALPSLELLLYRFIQVGVVLLAAGIMLGAVWANASWGRYWGWDPKETWALITLLWFLAALHGRFAGWLTGVGMALWTIGGFFLVLMTYYGVSFYLVGLHSYAGGHAKPLPPLLIAYLVAEMGFISLLSVRAVTLRGETKCAAS